MVVADRTDRETIEDAALDDSFRFRLYRREKSALQRAARAHDRRPGNFTRVIVRDWLREHGFLEPDTER